MNRIDPHSPRKAGRDLAGKIVRLGDLDSDGYFVGYISEDGTPWRDRTDRDLTVGVNVAFDAFMECNYHGGMLAPLPSIAEVLRAHDVPLDLLDAVRTEVNNWIGLYALASHERAVLATWN
jgi:hypothetical protein